MTLRRLSLITALLCMSLGAHAQNVARRVVEIPMAVKGFFGESHIKLAATEYRPEGDGPFPVLVINHGTPRSPTDFPKMQDRYARQAEFFAKRGFLVINPLRRGYGKSDGPWAENYFSCANPDYVQAGLETAKDIGAALDYARSLPYADAQHMVLLGKSAGGFGVLALSSLNPAGVVGTINFAGGRGSRGPDDVCNEAKLVDAFGRYASTTKVPMLWVYSENDHFFGPALASRLLAAYKAQGADVRFEGVPPYGNDGHAFFEGRDNTAIWVPMVDQFLAKLGLARQVQ
ncbi:alpha/beta hydrolase family protein [Variovorax sp. RB3P1]|jgi:dienelactone hydrolase|uniref:alpha/beta hydrolase family protein n=1 Tax=Variovorax sp. RB3P1 TaxID=3443732 RepID=UPI003F45E540